MSGRHESVRFRPPTRLAAMLGIVAAAASVAGCKEATSAEKVHYQPAKVTPIKGDDEHKIVTLTAEGARRIDLQTVEVARSGQRMVIPYASLLYQKHGEAFVYTNPKPLTYVWAPVEVDHVAGDRVLLKKGPPPGTRVVTVGAQQVHGAELEFGEY
jgi:hypothetical protein